MVDNEDKLVDNEDKVVDNEDRRYHQDVCQDRHCFKH